MDMARAEELRQGKISREHSQVRALEKLSEKPKSEVVRAIRCGDKIMEITPELLKSIEKEYFPDYSEAFRLILDVAEASRQVHGDPGFQSQVWRRAKELLDRRGKRCD